MSGLTEKQASRTYLIKQVWQIYQDFWAEKVILSTASYTPDPFSLSTAHFFGKKKN